MNPVTASLESILAEAVEIASSDERQLFVDRACAGDPGLLNEVERFIANHFRAGSFLERPAAVLQVTSAPTQCEAPGDLIGPYKLLEQIGEGGMGTVFMAEQSVPVQRKVALKIVK